MPSGHPIRPVVVKRDRGTMQPAYNCAASFTALRLGALARLREILSISRLIEQPGRCDSAVKRRRHRVCGVSGDSVWGQCSGRSPLRGL